MAEIIKSQNGKEIAPEKIRIGKFSFDIAAKKSGTVKSIDNIAISRIARIAGAPHDSGAGVYIHRHNGDKVRKGEKVLTVYSQGEHHFRYAKDFAKNHKIFMT